MSDSLVLAFGSLEASLDNRLSRSQSESTDEKSWMTLSSSAENRLAEHEINISTSVPNVDLELPPPAAKESFTVVLCPLYFPAPRRQGLHAAILPTTILSPSQWASSHLKEAYACGPPGPELPKLVGCTSEDHSVWAEAVLTSYGRQAQHSFARSKCVPTISSESLSGNDRHEFRLQGLLSEMSSRMDRLTYSHVLPESVRKWRNELSNSIKERQKRLFISQSIREEFVEECKKPFGDGIIGRYVVEVIEARNITPRTASSSACNTFATIGTDLEVDLKNKKLLKTKVVKGSLNPRFSCPPKSVELSESGTLLVISLIDKKAKKEKSFLGNASFHLYDLQHNLLNEHEFMNGWFPIKRTEDVSDDGSVAEVHLSVAYIPASSEIGVENYGPSCGLFFSCGLMDLSSEADRIIEHAEQLLQLLLLHSEESEEYSLTEFIPGLYCDFCLFYDIPPTQANLLYAIQYASSCEGTSLDIERWKRLRTVCDRLFLPVHQEVLESDDLPKKWQELWVNFTSHIELLLLDALGKFKVDFFSKDNLPILEYILDFAHFLEENEFLLSLRAHVEAHIRGHVAKEIMRYTQVESTDDEMDPALLQLLTVILRVEEDFKKVSEFFLPIITGNRLNLVSIFAKLVNTEIDTLFNAACEHTRERCMSEEEDDETKVLTSEQSTILHQFLMVSEELQNLRSITRKYFEDELIDVGEQSIPFLKKWLTVTGLKLGQFMKDIIELDSFLLSDESDVHQSHFMTSSAVDLIFVCGKIVERCERVLSDDGSSGFMTEVAELINGLVLMYMQTLGTKFDEVAQNYGLSTKEEMSVFHTITSLLNDLFAVTRFVEDDLSSVFLLSSSMEMTLNSNRSVLTEKIQMLGRYYKQSLNEQENIDEGIQHIRQVIDELHPQVAKQLLQRIDIG